MRYLHLDVFTDRRALAAAIGADESDLPRDVPAEVVPCGVPFLFVPLISRRAVDGVAVDRKSFQQCCRIAGIDELPTFFFTSDGDREPGAAHTAYSRMLAPGFGITEDPATGGASGPLGCYLLRHRIVTPDAARNIVSLQGSRGCDRAAFTFQSRARTAPSRACESVGSR